jgi:hypothetical protein
MAWPAPFPGWLLEPAGDGGPRGMTVTPRGAQDPAYRPTPLFLLASMLAASSWGCASVQVCQSSTPPRPFHGLVSTKAIARIHARCFVVGLRERAGLSVIDSTAAIHGLVSTKAIARIHPCSPLRCGLRECAGLSVINSTAAIHGLVSDNSRFEWHFCTRLFGNFARLQAPCERDA